MDFTLVFYPSEDIYYTNNNPNQDYEENIIIKSVKYNNCLLNQSDISRIKSGWFNDTVVDFFTKYFLDQLKEETRSTIYTFGASFYELLRNTDYNPTKTFFDVTKINTIIFPICTSYHFSLAIFHNILTVYSAVSEEDGSENMNLPIPAIICLDPLRIHSANQIAQKLRDFYVNILNKYFSKEKNITEIFPRLILPRITLQDNASDCGAYILSYFRYFVRHIPTITEKEIDRNLEEWTKDYDNWENPTNMRLELMDIIHRLYMEEKSESNHRRKE